MSRKFHEISWNDFDNYIETILSKIKNLDGCTGVYGVPRGGLVPAVALSHKTGLPLLIKPKSMMLWVDDIVDSGKTALSPEYECAFEKIVIVSLNQSINVLSAINMNKDTWVVFPWESKDNAIQDMRRYNDSRQ